MATSIFHTGLCGHLWADILTLLPSKFFFLWNKLNHAKVNESTKSSKLTICKMANSFIILEIHNETWYKCILLFFRVIQMKIVNSRVFEYKSQQLIIPNLFPKLFRKDFSSLIRTTAATYTAHSQILQYTMECLVQNFHINETTNLQCLLTECHTFLLHQINIPFSNLTYIKSHYITLNQNHITLNQNLVCAVLPLPL